MSQTLRKARTEGPSNEDQSSASGQPCWGWVGTTAEPDGAPVDLLLILRTRGCSSLDNVIGCCHCDSLPQSLSMFNYTLCVKHWIYEGYILTYVSIFLSLSPSLALSIYIKHKNVHIYSICIYMHIFIWAKYMVYMVRVVNMWHSLLVGAKKHWNPKSRFYAVWGKVINGLLLYSIIPFTTLTSLRETSS